LELIHLGTPNTTTTTSSSFNMRFSFKLATAVAVFLGLGATQEATRQIAIIGSSPMAVLGVLIPEMILDP
jgi:hypothetical protein